MSYTFTIDEDIIRRMLQRQKQEGQMRPGSLSRFWRGEPATREREAASGSPRPRWS